MGGLFSKKKKEPEAPKREQRGKGGTISEKDRAMLELKSARNKVQKYKKQQEKEVEKYKKQAMDLIKAGRKDRALMVLKIKK